MNATVQDPNGSPAPLPEHQVGAREFAKRWPFRLAVVCALIYFGLNALVEDVAAMVSWDIGSPSLLHVSSVAIGFGAIVTLALRWPRKTK